MNSLPLFLLQFASPLLTIWATVYLRVCDVSLLPSLVTPPYLVVQETISRLATAPDRHSHGRGKIKGGLSLGALHLLVRDEPDPEEPDAVAVARSRCRASQYTCSVSYRKFPQSQPTMQRHSLPALPVRRTWHDATERHTFTQTVLACHTP